MLPRRIVSGRLDDHHRSSTSPSSDAGSDAPEASDAAYSGKLAITVVAIERDGAKVQEPHFFKLSSVRNKKWTFKTQVSKSGLFLESSTLELDGSRLETVRFELYSSGLVASLVAALDMPISVIRGMMGSHTEVCSDFWLTLRDAKTHTADVNARVAFEFGRSDRALQQQIVETLTLAIVSIDVKKSATETKRKVSTREASRNRLLERVLQTQQLGSVEHAAAEEGEGEFSEGSEIRLGSYGSDHSVNSYADEDSSTNIRLGAYGKGPMVRRLRFLIFSCFCFCPSPNGLFAIGVCC
jgi:hypothetical protein